VRLQPLTYKELETVKRLISAPITGGRGTRRGCDRMGRSLMDIIERNNAELRNDIKK
jgi:hypothetical protein